MKFDDNPPPRTATDMLLQCEPQFARVLFSAAFYHRCGCEHSDYVGESDCYATRRWLEQLALLMVEIRVYYAKTFGVEFDRAVLNGIDAGELERVRGNPTGHECQELLHIQLGHVSPWVGELVSNGLAEADSAAEACTCDHYDPVADREIIAALCVREAGRVWGARVSWGLIP
ncbi:MAG: hypothetical protein L6Q99_05185 [Planctomycetes bacterium]|nr:hypothetical protein [Planctomycetota bacterium]